MNDRLFFVEGKGLRGETEVGMEVGSGVELGEKGRVFEGEFGGGGGGGEMEEGFEKRGGGEREGVGRGGEDVVLERDGFFQVFLSLDGEVEVWVSDPFDFGVHESAELV